MSWCVNGNVCVWNDAIVECIKAAKCIRYWSRH
ncbi:hypothetical protein F383_09584 [Gossypium arboreum]|uniref:Uncharacterized protein n=1 Tax=Gossypium arboreum TaxID=29729 RepID=A0A0B0NJ73_GOSAR|nr:hypothetical protein F383_09584 [Gossypium arboreum]